MRPAWHVGAAAAIAAPALLIAGCGSAPAPSEPPAAGATVRKAAAYPAVTCPNADHVVAHLLLRNTTDIDLKINSSNTNGGDICRWFSGARNPTAFNGTTVLPGRTLDLPMSMREPSATWKLSFMPAGAYDPRVIDTPEIQYTKGQDASSPTGAAGSVLLRRGGVWSERFLVGPVKDANGRLVDLVATGGPGQTLMLAYKGA